MSASDTPSEPKNEDDGTEAKPVEKAAEKPEAAPAKDDAKDAGDAKEEKAEAKAEPKAEAKPKPATPAAKPAATAKSVNEKAKAAAVGAAAPKSEDQSIAMIVGVVVLLVIGGIAVFALSNRDQPSAAPGAPANGGGKDPTADWAVGKTVDVELTLKPTDSGNLACASNTEINGKKCEFDGDQKARPADQVADETKLLKPYSTTGSARIIAGGLWSQPTLAKDKLPADRFRVACKFAIEGKVPGPTIRWDKAQAFRPQKTDWFAGTLQNCNVKK